MEYYREITIDHTKVSGTLTNFPIFLDITLGSNVANANGYDVHFTTADGNTELYFDLEHYDNSTKRWRGWVRINSLGSVSDTVIRVYYGDSGITTNQSSSSTWVEFAGVWFLSEQTTGSSVYKDRTSNANHMSSVGSQLTAGVTGKLTYALSRNGSTGEVSRAITDANMNNPSGDLMVLAWLKTNADSQNGNAQAIWEESNGRFRFYTTGSTAWQWRIYRTAGQLGSITAQTQNQTWRRIAVRVSNADAGAYAYMDGSNTGYAANAYSYMGTNDKVAVLSSGTASQGANASISHLMILQADKGAGWITTDYNNQNDPATFSSLGSEQGGSAEWESNPEDEVDISDTMTQAIAQAIAHTPTVADYVDIAKFIIRAFSAADDGFANVDTPGDTDPFNEGEQISYTVQAGDTLPDGTYYWRVRAKDPSGSNTWGAWSEVREFTILSGDTYTPTLPDSAEVSDTLSRVITNVLGDSITASDLTSKEVGKHTDDDIAATDILRQDIGKSVAINATVADAQGRQIGHVIVTAATVADNLGHEAAFARVAADGVNVGDDTTKAADKGIDDGMAVDSGIAKDICKNITDNTEVSDNLEPATIVAQSNADSIEVADAQARNVGNVLADTATADDTAAQQVGHGISDTAAGADAQAREVGKNIASSAEVVENIDLAKVLPTGHGDGVQVSDGIMQGASKGIYDTATADAGVDSKAVGHAISDVSDVSGVIARNVDKTLADAASASDSPAFAIGRVLQDGTELSDAVAQTIGEVLADMANISDLVHTAQAHVHLLADSVTAADVQARQIAHLIATSVSVDDAVSKVIGEVLAENVLVKDVLLAVIPGQILGGTEAAIGQQDNQVDLGQANDGLQLGQADAIAALEERGIGVELQQLDNEVVLTLRKQ